MNSYGEKAADDLVDENAVVVMAALAGDLVALRLLLKVACQSAYVAGYGAAASVVGVEL